MSVINSVRGRIIVVCHRSQYLVHSSSIFWLIQLLCATTLTIILCMLVAEILPNSITFDEKTLKYYRAGSTTIIWSLILVNVNSSVLHKPMKMRYLPIMKSDLKKLLRNCLVLQRRASQLQRRHNKCMQEC